MLNVLIVEDEKPVRMLTRAKLKNEYNILEAANGAEALDVFEIRSVRGIGYKAVMQREADE